MEPATKSVLQSRTLWVQVIAIVIMIVGTQQPAVAAFLSEHFSAVGGGWAILNIALRLITKDKIAIIG